MTEQFTASVLMYQTFLNRQAPLQLELLS